MCDSVSCDVVVMGGGPGGAAVGNFLAQAGLDVLIIEGERHPRHHIGESLLPGTVPILNRLGISSAELARRFQPKFGARFYDPATDQTATFGFEPTAGSVSPAYQVMREEFDELLAERAAAAGCRVLQEAVIEEFDEASAWVKLRDGRRIEGRFLVDATGRAALVSARRKRRTVINDYGRLGVYNYFAELPPHDDRDADFITMYIFEGGWVWLIPLRDGRTSVGIVYRDVPVVEGNAQGRLEKLFWHATETMPRLKKRLRAARVTEEYRAISDYSFTIESKFGEKWAAVGDAGGFLDPIFSSGVHLALSSAELAAAGIAEKLRTGSDAGLRAYSDHMDAGFKVFQAFVHRFYNRALVHNLFFMPNKPAEIHLAITRILAGHVWDETNPVIKIAVDHNRNGAKNHQE